MQKLERYRLERTMPVVKLYESGVQHIIDILVPKEYTTVKLKTEDAQFDGIEDLRRHTGDRHNQFTIEAKYRPEGRLPDKLSVYFRESDVSVEAERQFELEYHRIVEFLESKSRWSGRIPRDVWYGMSGTLWAVLTIAPLAAQIALKLRLRYSLLLLVFTLVVTLALAKKRRPFFRRNVIILAKAHEHLTFWQRHEENWVRGAIGLITGLLGVGLGYWLGKS